MKGQRVEMNKTAERAANKERARRALRRMERILSAIIRAGGERKVTRRGKAAKEALAGRMGESSEHLNVFTLERRETPNTKFETRTLRFCYLDMIPRGVFTEEAYTAVLSLHRAGMLSRQLSPSRN